MSLVLGVLRSISTSRNPAFASTISARFDLAQLGSLASVVVAGALGLTAAGCSVDPSGTGPMLVPHCGDDLGDQTCQVGQAGRPYCDLCKPASQNQGCVAQPPAVPACRPGPTGPTTLSTSGPEPTGDVTDSSSSTGETSPTTQVDTSGSDSSSSGGPIVECMGDDGEPDDDCLRVNPDRPYCIDNVCRGCNGAGGDTFCEQLDAVAPACESNSGTCVACGDAEEFACPSDRPICDGSGACLGCAAHSDCPDTACHLDPSDPLWGECFADGEVVWVDNNEICPGAGTEASPNCSLSAALGAADEGESLVINLAGGGAPYDENVLLDEDAYVAIIGSSAPTVSGGVGVEEASLRVHGGVAYLSGVRFAGNLETHGVDCAKSVLWLQNSEIGNNTGYGLYNSSDCRLNVVSSSIHHNTGGGVRALGGRLRLENASVGVNGSGIRGPALLLQYVDVDILYATIVGNDGIQYDSIQCLEASGSVRNSVVVGATGPSVSLDCFQLEYDRNAIDTVGFTGPEGTLVTSEYNPTWFVDEPGGDFRLNSPALTPFGDVAVWAPGDPPLDADGTERPVGGEAGFAGVDEPG